MRRLKYTKSSIAALATTFAAIVACDSSAPRGPGAIRIAASSQIAEPLFFVYGISIDDGTPREVFAGQSLTFLTAGLSHGKHSITVDSVPSVCTGDNRQEVDLKGDDTVAVIVVIQCARTSGDLQVTVATTGPDQDANGYSVLLDQQFTGYQVPASGGAFVQFVLPGSHTVSLGDVASNCTASAAQTVTVTAGNTASATFTVTCKPVSTIRIITSASGTERDPDGVTLKIDNGEELRGPVTGTLNGTTTTGTHSYVIGDVAPNCTLSVPATGTVTLAEGEVVTINVTLTCADVGYGVVGVLASDPADDTLRVSTSNNFPAPHDVRAVSARYVSGWLLLVMRFAKPTGSSFGSLGGLHGVVDLDSDENASTGGEPLINSFGGSANQGSDYAIDLFSTDSISAEIFKFSNGFGVLAGRVRTKFEGDSVVVQIPLNKLGNDDGNMTVTGVIGTADRPTDIFPNAGVITARVAGPMVAQRGPTTTGAAKTAAAARPAGGRATVIRRPGDWKVPR